MFTSLNWCLPANAGALRIGGGDSRHIGRLSDAVPVPSIQNLGWIDTPL